MFMALSAIWCFKRQLKAGPDYDFAVPLGYSCFRCPCPSSISRFSTYFMPLLVPTGRLVPLERLVPQAAALSAYTVNPARGITHNFSSKAFLYDSYEYKCLCYHRLITVKLCGITALFVINVNKNKNFTTDVDRYNQYTLAIPLNDKFRTKF